MDQNLQTSQQARNLGREGKINEATSSRSPSQRWAQTETIKRASGIKILSRFCHVVVVQSLHVIFVIVSTSMSPQSSRSPVLDQCTAVLDVALCSTLSCICTGSQQSLSEYQRMLTVVKALRNGGILVSYPRVQAPCHEISGLSRISTNTGAIRSLFARV